MLLLMGAGDANGATGPDPFAGRAGDAPQAWSGWLDSVTRGAPPVGAPPSTFQPLAVPIDSSPTFGPILLGPLTTPVVPEGNSFGPAAGGAGPGCDGCGGSPTAGASQYQAVLTAAPQQALQEGAGGVLRALPWWAWLIVAFIVWQAVKRA